MNKFFLYIPTLGPIGYLPAPGTAATLATIPLVILAHAYLAYPLYVGLVFGA